MSPMTTGGIMFACVFGGALLGMLHRRILPDDHLSSDSKDVVKLGMGLNTDATREYAYDRDSKSGRLDKALDEAKARGWTVVDMKADWKVIFPFEKK